VGDYACIEVAWYPNVRMVNKPAVPKRNPYLVTDPSTSSFGDFNERLGVLQTEG
jgi:hypothetical protein